MESWLPSRSKQVIKANVVGWKCLLFWLYLICRPLPSLKNSSLGSCLCRVYIPDSIIECVTGSSASLSDSTEETYESMHRPSGCSCLRYGSSTNFGILTGREQLPGGGYFDEVERRGLWEWFSLSKQFSFNVWIEHIDCIIGDIFPNDLVTLRALFEVMELNFIYVSQDAPS